MYDNGVNAVNIITVTLDTTRTLSGGTFEQEQFYTCH